MNRNPKHENNFKIEGYKNLGWQNSWKSVYEDKKFVGFMDQPEYNKCRELGHKTREIDNSLYLNRGTDNVVICDICKIYSHYDCSD